MQLKVISAANFKGKTFTHQLGAGTAIIGPNFAGKTAIIQAIVLLFKGYIPQVGKTPKSTWELSSGQQMVVHGEFDADWTFSRHYHLEGLTVKTSTSSVTAPEKADELQIKILENIPLLDADEYFGMTDRERTNYVFARIKLPEAFTAEGIIAELEQISFEEAHTEQIQKAKALQLKSVRKSFEEVSIQDALEALVEVFAGKFTEWNRRQKETQGAVKTLTELKLREPEISTDSLAALEADITAAQQVVQGLAQTAGRLSAQRDEIARNKAGIAQLEERLAAERTDYDAAIARYDTFIQEQTEGMVPEDEALLEQRKTTRKELSLQIDALTASIQEIERTYGQVKVSLTDLAEMKHCPTCLAKAKGWKLNVEKSLTASLEAAEARLIEERQRLEVAQDQLLSFERLILKAERDASDNLTRRNSIEGARRDRQQTVKYKATDDERRAQWQKDLNERKGWVAPTLENGFEEIEEQRVDAAGKLQKLRQRKEAAQALQHDLRRASEAQIEHLDAAANVAVIKRIQGVLSNRRDMIVAEVFNTLLMTANRICGSIFQTPLTLCNNTIGRWSHDGKFIPHRTFSGTEKALTYIAIATALSSQSPIRLAILDEFGRLDEDNQMDVLRNLKKAIESEIIDQFIVVGTSLPDDWNSDDFTYDGFQLQVIQMKP